MARSLVMVAAWLGGTVAAVALGVEAIDVVTASVTETRPAPLSSGAVTEALTGGQAGGEEPGAGAPSEPGSDLDGGQGAQTNPGSFPGTSSRPRQGSSTASAPFTATTARAPGGGTATSVPGVTTTLAPAVAPSPTGTVPATSPTTAAAAPSPPPEDRTYRLVGGTVGVRFESNQAHLLWAQPEAGFRVQSSGSSSQVDIRFLSQDHESRLKAYWNNGPRAEVEERKI